MNLLNTCCSAAAAGPGGAFGNARAANSLTHSSLIADHAKRVHMVHTRYAWLPNFCFFSKATPPNCLHLILRTTLVRYFCDQRNLATPLHTSYTTQISMYKMLKFDFYSCQNIILAPFGNLLLQNDINFGVEFFAFNIFPHWVRWITFFEKLSALICVILNQYVCKMCSCQFKLDHTNSGCHPFKIQTALRWVSS